MKIYKKILFTFMLACISTMIFAEEKEIKVTIKDTDGIVTKTVIVDGKKLTDAEIATMQANGEFETVQSDAPVGKQKTLIFINTNTDETDENHSIKNVNKVISKTISIDDNNATLGLMANIKDDGWHVIAVIKGSGAEEAGLKEGDVIKFMSGIDLSKSSDNPLTQTIGMINKQEGDMVELDIERDGKMKTLMVEARKNNTGDMLMNIVNDNQLNSMTWSDDIKNIDVSKHIGIVVMDSDNSGKFDFNFNSDDINVVMPDSINDLNMFISQGSSTLELLGENNQLASLSKDLAKYFKTDSGVLVISAGKDNLFGLKDGDVIKSIDGENVDTPKDVIKQLLKADKQEDIKLKIVRHNRNKTLKYNK